MKTIKKIFSVCIAAALCVASVSCGKKDNGKSDVIDVNYEWLKDTYTDSSQLSDYAGQNQINLVAWNVDGQGGGKSYEASDDVVSKEIKRVTGVSISDKSFDNGGVTSDVKYGQLIATNRLPDIAYGSSWTVDTDAVYDLTELIDKYCPTIKSRIPKNVWNTPIVNAGQKGKVYGIPYALGNIGLSAVDELADPKKTLMFEYTYDPYPYVYVREDVLTTAYPNAKTTAQLGEIYSQRGSFTEEELFDVKITSAEQFRTEFLPKIYNVLRTAKNDDGTYRYQKTSKKWVEPMLVTDGQDRDTWSFLGKLVPSLLGSTMINGQFMYFDAQTKKVERTFSQDFYKDEVYEWAKLISEGKYVSNYGMTINNAEIQAELNNGNFAIAYYPSNLVSGNTAQYTGINGKTESVKYRKVYMKIPVNEHFKFVVGGSAAPSAVYFFKDNVKESDLAQLLRWLDYQCSRLADKVYAWGPKSAGLFDEAADGTRSYKDSDLVTQMVYSTGIMGSKVQKYNLSNGTVKSAKPVFSFFYNAGSIYHPKCVYDVSKMSDFLMSAFASGVVCSDVEQCPLAHMADMHSWKNSEIPGVEQIWAKRELLEAEFKTVLQSGASKSKFDAAYSTLLSVADRAGFSTEFANTTVTNKFLELNADFISNLLG